MESRFKTFVTDRVRSALSVRTRHRIALGRVAVRQWNARERALPNLLIIGAQRCGTSSLYKYLEQHPQVVSSLRKEVEYFTGRFDSGELWYRAHFPLEKEVTKRGVRILFEASPNYILDPRCAERAVALLPEARVVALLRNPVERAYSHYQHNRRRSTEPLSFADAIRAEKDRVEPSRLRLEDNPGLPLPVEMRRYSYVMRGLYAKQLEKWLDVYGPDRVHIVTSEAMFASPADTFQKLAAFLGIIDWLPKTFANHSYVGGAKATPEGEMTADIRQYLEGLFFESNRELSSLTGLDFGWEKSAD